MPVRRPRAPLAALVAVLVTAGPALSGCSAGDDPRRTPEGAPGVSQAPSPPPVATRSRIENVEGRLAPADRTRLRERVQLAVDGWVDAAYGGDYPRDDFGSAYDSFTERAAVLARADAGLTSNAPLGPRLQAVRPVRRQVTLDVLAPGGQAAAVTARVRVVLELSGPVARTEAISGSLYLTYVKDDDGAGWRIFGYDLTRTEL